MFLSRTKILCASSFCLLQFGVCFAGYSADLSTGEKNEKGTSGAAIAPSEASGESGSRSTADMSAESSSGSTGDSTSGANVAPNENSSGKTSDTTSPSMPAEGTTSTSTDPKPAQSKVQEAGVPDGAAALIESAKNKASKGNIVGARADLDEAIKNYPGSRFAYFERARVKIAQKQYASAVDDCTESLKIKKAAGVLMERSAAKGALKDFDGALADAESAVACAPNSLVTANAIFQRGKVRQQQEKYKEAIVDFNAAIAINPKRANFYLQKGFSEIELKQFVDARKDLEKSLDINPKLAAAHTDLCYLDMLTKDYIGALKEADQVVLLDPTSAKAYEYRGKTQNSMGDYNAALKDLTKAVELGGGNEEITAMQKQLSTLIKVDAARKFPASPTDSKVDQSIKLTREQEKLATAYVEEVERSVKHFWAPDTTSTVSKETSIRFMIDPTGKLFDITIHTSSGYPEFDETVKAAVEKAGSVKKPLAFLTMPVHMDVHFDMKVTRKNSPN